MRQTFTMTVPLALTVSSNRRAETWKRQKVKDAMRELTRVHGARLYPCGSATIHVGVTKRTGGRYDPTNLTDTMKGAVDELVTMRVLEDDDYRHVAGPWMYHAGVDRTIPAGHMRLTVTLTDYCPVPAAVTA